MFIISALKTALSPLAANNFWQKLPRPFFALAPMYDVTDAAFRAMFAKYGRPDVCFTEFVSAEGLASEIGRSKLLRELYFTDKERPIVAQIFGARPEAIEAAAGLVVALGFAGVDLNLGCPDRAVEKQGAGAALIREPSLTKEIIAAAKAGAGGRPVSVKTRLGYHELETEAWSRALLEAKPEAITFHLRTRRELSAVPARWPEIRIPVALAAGTETVIIGNGDVRDLDQGRHLAETYRVPGVMIGRGAFGRPWFFSGQAEPPLARRLAIMLEHTRLFWDLYGATETNRSLFGGHQKNFAVMRKHFKAYVSGFAGATLLRAKLMTAQNPAEVESIIKPLL
ncbi:MAG: tRNA-dihydrouridine synthase [Candidatus Vogelbacteria bacterium CG10_big_fil_rev_8_21_14_0_10_49_38]|uniref:tRNA-dihydrouridine synthase n=1 Tax=Candidatus Vogelbacteria bacterium CG10_big_fil_rev_8_21_14_0_10_49_38 TaxID=1975043 RepID=A0A2H0RK58_9BACT|nr:MAG: hypothetical protein BK006_01215 [bacterium CG10_49_38]PIR46155.1 MAG: tRNA-dihydrouridine synthase [Candidatus Vogelbacteria bacterium CG10_big_fil_rev_8_21_14_0_10_49_38]